MSAISSSASLSREQQTARFTGAAGWALLRYGLALTDLLLLGAALFTLAKGLRVSRGRAS
jgi:hypothetical protein